jgi:hypothetical protein
MYRHQPLLALAVIANVTGTGRHVPCQPLSAALDAVISTKAVVNPMFVHEFHEFGARRNSQLSLDAVHVIGDGLLRQSQGPCNTCVVRGLKERLKNVTFSPGKALPDRGFARVHRGGIRARARG